MNREPPSYLASPDLDREADTRLRVAVRRRYEPGQPFRNVLAGLPPELANLVTRVGYPHALRIEYETYAAVSLERIVQVTRPRDPDDFLADVPLKAQPDELTAMRKTLTQRLRHDFAGKKIVVRVDEAALAEILGMGRIRSQLETDRSGGYFNPEYRRVIEQALFGLPPSADPNIRPVYGYVAVEGVDALGGPDALDRYGTVRLVLSDSVRRRTTATVGDSLDEHVIPTPVNDPSWESYVGVHALVGDDAVFDFAAHRDRIYVEAQVHGGVSTKDIEEAVFVVEPSRVLRDALADRGIRWRGLHPRQ